MKNKILCYLYKTLLTYLLILFSPHVAELVEKRLIWF